MTILSWLIKCIKQSEHEKILFSLHHYKEHELYSHMDWKNCCKVTINDAALRTTTMTNVVWFWLWSQFCGVKFKHSSIKLSQSSSTRFVAFKFIIIWICSFLGKQLNEFIFFSGFKRFINLFIISLTMHFHDLFICYSFFLESQKENDDFFLPDFLVVLFLVLRHAMMLHACNTAIVITWTASLILH